MKNIKMILAICMALLLCLLTFGTALADRDRGKTYSVTITNLTKKQVITPPLVISHASSYNLFMIGQPAGEGLVAIAEGGDTSTLAAMLGTRDDIVDYQMGGGPILPGHSMTIMVKGKSRHNQLSVVGMLASTNDAFVAVKGVSLPAWWMKTKNALAYDAGSEANTELCSDLPGPPCAGDSGNERVTEGAEGFVHVHNGIHGVGDLSEANMDWHNPAAKIVIKRMKH